MRSPRPDVKNTTNPQISTVQLELISNVEMSPKEALDWYFGRIDIEEFFKTSKGYISLLSLSKWNDTTVRGKILLDIIRTCVYKDTRHTIAHVYPQGGQCHNRVSEQADQGPVSGHGVAGVVPPVTRTIQERCPSARTVVLLYSEFRLISVESESVDSFIRQLNDHRWIMAVDSVKAYIAKSTASSLASCFRSSWYSMLYVYGKYYHWIEQISFMLNYDQNARSIKADGVVELGSVLKEIHYIPKYQRDYNWKVEQCKDLMMDLERFIRNKRENSKYMFGQIVFYNNTKNQLYILDGQQRLTTSSLLIAAYRNIIVMMNQKNPESVYSEYLIDDISISKQYLCTGTLDNVNLKVSKENLQIYEKILRGKASEIHFTELDTNSKQNLFHNYTFFYEYLCKLIHVEKDSYDTIADDFFKGTDQYFKVIHELYQTFIGFRVSAVYSYYLDEAYELFESINNRGIKLSSMDLLKNHVFCKCYADDDSLDQDRLEVEKKWDIIRSKTFDLVLSTSRSKTSSTKIEKIQDKMLRYYVRTTVAPASIDKTYSFAISKISTQNDALLFLKEYTAALEYFRLAFNDSYLTEEISERTKNMLRSLNGVAFDSCTPAILSVYLVNKGKPDLDDKLRQILSAYLRFYILGIFPKILKTSTIEESTSKLAISYYYGQCTLEEMVSSIYSEISADQETIKVSIVLNEYDNNAAKLVLSELYEKVNTTVNVNRSEATLEHIMPEEYRKYWPEISEDTHKKYLKKLGNLLLLNHKINSQIKNREFAYKKQWYESGEMEMPEIQYSDICGELIMDREIWDNEAIDERTIYLAESLVKFFY